MDFENDVARLALLVQRMVDESGQPDGFNAQGWIREWTLKCLPALANRRPIDVLGEPGGFEVVSGILSRMESGAYS